MTRSLALLLVMIALATPAGAAKIPSTHLLFTHVVNIDGFDTAIVISNTSMDPFGTAPESGTCTLSFFGTGAPGPFTTPTIAAGDVFTGLTSLMAAGFNGYVFADCSFNHAHGITFVADVGARNIAYGDEALVLPAKKKRPVAGERLSH